MPTAREEIPTFLADLSYARKMIIFFARKRERFLGVFWVFFGCFLGVFWVFFGCFWVCVLVFFLFVFRALARIFFWVYFSLSAKQNREFLLCQRRHLICFHKGNPKWPLALLEPNFRQKTGLSEEYFSVIYLRTPRT